MLFSIMHIIHILGVILWIGTLDRGTRIYNHHCIPRYIKDHGPPAEGTPISKDRAPVRSPCKGL
jgi:hypothetical protein